MAVEPAQGAASSTKQQSTMSSSEPATFPTLNHFTALAQSTVEVMPPSQHAPKRGSFVAPL